DAIDQSPEHLEASKYQSRNLYILCYILLVALPLMRQCTPSLHSLFSCPFCQLLTPSVLPSPLQTGNA
uniref:Uncharacterized protein n=1 Tax=Loxodonta africana TaxID=9785 RepID=G3U7R7_LOXAF